MRLIDADDLRCRMVNGNDRITIDCAPTINAVPVVHGRWVHPHTLGCCCSICGEQPEREPGESVPLYDYCPYCGARMDGEEAQQ